MASSIWLPVAIATSIGSSFFMWYCMDEWMRARYFPILAGLPVTVFAIYGLFAWGQTQKLKR